MENENLENDNSLNVENETETLETETQTETLSAEELKTLRERAKLADELEDKNKKLYARLKKDTTKETKEDKVDSSITAKDVLILSGAGITHEEDVEAVESWAKYKGISIKEALNDSMLKTVLATKQEERKTAQLTQTRGGARGTSTPSADAILADARKGKISESETEIANLAQARMQKRLEQLGK